MRKFDTQNLKIFAARPKSGSNFGFPYINMENFFWKLPFLLNIFEKLRFFTFILRATLRKFDSQNLKIFAARGVKLRFPHCKKCQKSHKNFSFRSLVTDPPGTAHFWRYQKLARLKDLFFHNSYLTYFHGRVSFSARFLVFIFLRFILPRSKKWRWTAPHSYAI